MTVGRRRRIAAEVWRRVTRRPAILVGAITATVYGIWPDASEVIVAAWGLVAMDLLTESRAEVAEKVDAGRMVGALEHQAVAAAGAAIAATEALNQAQQTPGRRPLRAPGAPAG